MRSPQFGSLEACLKQEWLGLFDILCRGVHKRKSAGIIGQLVITIFRSRLPHITYNMKFRLYIALFCYVRKSCIPESSAGCSVELADHGV